MKDENEVIDPDEAAAKRIASVFVAWNESRKTWREFVAGLKEAAEDMTAAYQIAVTCVPPGGQLPLIPGAVAGVVAEPKQPRKPRRVMMHSPPGGSQWTCPACGATANVATGTTDAALNRGIPCPACNGPAAEPDGEK